MASPNHAELYLIPSTNLRLFDELSKIEYLSITMYIQAKIDQLAADETSHFIK